MEKRAKGDAEHLFHPPVTADRLRVTKKEVDGPFALITVESPRGMEVILRYAWRTKQLLGSV